MPEDEDEYITAEAAGEILGVSPRQAMRYGVTDDIRRIEEGRKFLYHAGDVRALAEKQQGRRQRVTSGVSRSMSRPNEWRTKYEEANEKNMAAAHTIGRLEQQIAQLQEEIARRPSADAYAELERRYNQLLQLTQEPEPPVPLVQPATPTAKPNTAPTPKPWWKIWGK